MKLSRILNLSFNMLLHSKLRSWLTIIGIVIGVAAVVSIISIGQGLQQSVNSQISGLGQNIITITAGGSRAAGGGFGGGSSGLNTLPLSDKDIQTLKLVPGISYISGVLSGRATIYHNAQNASISITGVDTSDFSTFVTTSLTSGRVFNTGETGSVVIGSHIASNLFSTPLEVGSTLDINNNIYRVIGILSSSSGFGGSDSAVYMSLTDARNVLGNTITLTSNQYSEIEVAVADVNTINDTSNSITSALINERHSNPNKPDFTVTSALALEQTFSSLTSTITLFLGLIAAVSVLVGSIGVANTMFTSVLEKTKDIGIMKAIGAKNSDILLIFLINSGMLGFVGGAIGILVGAGISSILPAVLGSSLGLPGSRGGFTTALSFSLLFFSLLFSVVIGMVSGAIPAWRASKLKPVDALRYE